MSSFGIKTTPVSTGKGIRRKRMKYQQDLKALDQQIQSAQRALLSQDMTRVEFSNLIKKLTRRKVELAKEFARKVKR
jgi:hypothetical protein